MSRPNKLFLSAWLVFCLGNIFQIVVVSPFMLAFGIDAIRSGFPGGMGRFLAYQANTLPLILVWMATAVVFFFAVRAELRSEQ